MIGKDQQNLAELTGDVVEIPATGRLLDEETMLDQARRIVFEHIAAVLEKTDTHVTFGREDVYVVWFAKTLGNWKALVSTTLPDGMYYEVTHNGAARETYLDVYKKWENVVIVDER